MQISITGGAGYIGRHLVAEIQRNADSRIKVLSRSRGPAMEDMNLGASVEVVEGDLCEPDSLKGFWTRDVP